MQERGRQVTPLRSERGALKGAPRATTWGQSPRGQPQQLHLLSARKRGLRVESSMAVHSDTHRRGWVWSPALSPALMPSLSVACLGETHINPQARFTIIRQLTSTR